MQYMVVYYEFKSRYNKRSQNKRELKLPTWMVSGENEENDRVEQCKVLDGNVLAGTDIKAMNVYASWRRQ